MASSRSSKSTTSSPGYILEWTSQACHRHVLSSTEELRSEILAGECPGVGRLLVLPGSTPDDSTLETLRDIAGVDDGFLEAHTKARAYRPKSHPRSRGVKGWCWKFPLRGAAVGRRTAGTERRSKSGITMCSASLWTASGVRILLIDSPALPLEKPPKPTPKLHHQDAATRLSTLQPSGPYGGIGQRQLSPPPPQLEKPPVATTGQLSRGIEDDLRNALKGAVSSSVEEVLGELLHERWLEFLASMRLRGGDCTENVLWDAMGALEQNVDEAKYAARHGRQLESAGVEAWEALLQRLQLRINLKTSSSSSSSSSTPSKPASTTPFPSAYPDRDMTDRSLNRIAYLGGLLLPVTVISGILSIDTAYGPGGHSFWIFWLASGLSTLLALLVIYLDQLRLKEVWREVGDVLHLSDSEARDAGSDDDDDDDGNREDGRGGYVWQRRGDGSKAKMWRRDRLGWGGAVKEASGYYRFRGSQGVEFRKPQLILDTVEAA